MGCDVSLFSGIEFFDFLKDDDRRELANVVDAIKLNAGETLFHTGDPGEALFVVRSGSIELYIKDTAGQKIVLHIDSLTGPTIASLVTTSTGSWSTYANESTSISKVTGVHSLYIQFVGSTGIANLQSFKFA